MVINTQEKQSPFFHSVLSLFLIGLIWSAYIATNLIAKTHETWVWPGIAKLVIDNGMILLLAVVFFVLWRKAEKKSLVRIIFASLTIAHSSLFIAATVYNGVYNILHLPHSETTWIYSALDDVFFTGFLLFGLLALILILLSTKINARRFTVIYTPIILVACVLAVISFYNIKWNITGSSLISGIYTSAEKVLEIAYIVGAAICVATAKNKGIFYLALGFLISIVTEVTLAFGVFSQSYGISSFFESGWVLGELLALYGVIILASSKDLNNICGLVCNKKR